MLGGKEWELGRARAASPPHSQTTFSHLGASRLNLIPCTALIRNFHSDQPQLHMKDSLIVGFWEMFVSSRMRVINSSRHARRAQDPPATHHSLQSADSLCTSLPFSPRTSLISVLYCTSVYMQVIRSTSSPIYQLLHPDSEFPYPLSLPPALTVSSSSSKSISNSGAAFRASRFSLSS